MFNISKRRFDQVEIPTSTYQKEFNEMVNKFHMVKTALAIMEIKWRTSKKLSYLLAIKAMQRHFQKTRLRAKQLRIIIEKRRKSEQAMKKRRII